MAFLPYEFWSPVHQFVYEQKTDSSSIKNLYSNDSNFGKIKVFGGIE